MLAELCHLGCAFGREVWERAIMPCEPACIVHLAWHNVLLLPALSQGKYRSARGVMERLLVTKLTITNKLKINDRILLLLAY